jgi:hypothetical protein
VGRLLNRLGGGESRQSAVRPADAAQAGLPYCLR